MKNYDAPEFRRIGDVLVGVVSGPVSLDRLLRIRAEQCLQWSEELPVGTVMDFTDATFHLTPKEWDHAFRAALRWTYNFQRPTAMVVHPGQLDLFNAGADEFAQHGIVQAAFTSFEQAVSWALNRRESRPPPPGRSRSARCRQL